MRLLYGAIPEFASFNQTPPISSIQDLMMKALTDFSKLYNSEALKFNDEMYGILNTKLKIFHKMYCKADIEPCHYHKTFSTMLKGRAHQFYYDHLTEHGFNFNKMIYHIKDFFHTIENHQLYLQE